MLQRAIYAPDLQHVSIVSVAPLSVWKEPRPPCVVETSLPGVFAAGDCRSGSPKRVAFAIGDGATAVTSVHKFLGKTVSERTSGEMIP